MIKSSLITITIGFLSYLVSSTAISTENIEICFSPSIATIKQEAELIPNTGMYKTDNSRTTLADRFVIIGFRLTSANGSPHVYKLLNGHSFDLSVLPRTSYVPGIAPSSLLRTAVHYKNTSGVILLLMLAAEQAESKGTSQNAAITTLLMQRSGNDNTTPAEDAMALEVNSADDVHRIQILSAILQSSANAMAAIEAFRTDTSITITVPRPDLERIEFYRQQTIQRREAAIRSRHLKRLIGQLEWEESTMRASLEDEQISMRARTKRRIDINTGFGFLFYSLRLAEMRRLPTTTVTSSGPAAVSTDRLFHPDQRMQRHTLANQTPVTGAAAQRRSYSSALPLRSRRPHSVQDTPRNARDMEGTGLIDLDNYLSLPHN